LTVKKAKRESYQSSRYSIFEPKSGRNAVLPLGGCKTKFLRMWNWLFEKMLNEATLFGMWLFCK
jgi:hypothetical protein